MSSISLEKIMSTTQAMMRLHCRVIEKAHTANSAHALWIITQETDTARSEAFAVQTFITETAPSAIELVRAALAEVETTANRARASILSGQGVSHASHS